MLLTICSTVLAAGVVDSAQLNPTAPAAEAAKNPDDENKQSDLQADTQTKESAASSSKRSRYDQDNAQQSTTNAQDLFQGDHN